MTSVNTMEHLQPYLLHLTLSSVAAVYCLLGYWLALGKQWWLYRAAAMCVALALLVPIRAYEPLVFFVFTTLFFGLAAATQQLVRRKQRAGESNLEGSATANRRFQFGLQDMLGLMAILGVVAWGTATLIREHVLMPWLGTVISTLVAVPITLSVVGMLCGPWRITSGLVLATVIGSSVAYFSWLHRLGAPIPSYIIGGDLGDQLFWSGSLYPSPTRQIVVLLSLFMLFLVLFFLAARVLLSGGLARQRRRKVLAAFPIAVWFLPTAWLYAQLLSYPQPPKKNAEVPNALTEILERGQPLERLTGNQARALAAEIVELSKGPGFVEIPWHANYLARREFDNNFLVGIQTARSISRGLYAQATSLEDSDPDSAAEYSMSIV